MSSWRALRRRVLTPNVSATKLDVRGFREKNASAKATLETVGLTFLTGYGCAVQARTPTEAETDLQDIETRFRGFAYEGAAMGFAVLDGLPWGRTDHVARFLAGRGDDHIYMAYIGVGWAMARLPRFRWSTLHAPDPLLHWLVLDGYGFHQAYFHTDRYVYGQLRHQTFNWPLGDPHPYALRVIDQGIGRALWFVAGSDPMAASVMIDSFEPDRRADLYSGVGLAATYAGGADRDELSVLWQEAGQYRPQLAQGAAFAAGARVRAKLVVPHNQVATEVFCGMSTEKAAAITDETLPDPSEGGSDEPAYELWRRRIATELMTLGRC